MSSSHNKFAELAMETKKVCQTDGSVDGINFGPQWLRKPFSDSGAPKSLRSPCNKATTDSDHTNLYKIRSLSGIEAFFMDKLTDTASNSFFDYGTVVPTNCQGLVTKMNLLSSKSSPVKLAEWRYAKEELLALYDKTQMWSQLSLQSVDQSNLAQKLGVSPEFSVDMLIDADMIPEKPFEPLNLSDELTEESEKVAMRQSNPNFLVRREFYVSLLGASYDPTSLGADSVPSDGRYPDDPSRPFPGNLPDQYGRSSQYVRGRGRGRGYGAYNGITSHYSGAGTEMVPNFNPIASVNASDNRFNKSGRGPRPFGTFGRTGNSRSTFGFNAAGGGSAGFNSGTYNATDGSQRQPRRYQRPSDVENWRRPPRENIQEPSVKDQWNDRQTDEQKGHVKTEQPSPNKVIPGHDVFDQMEMDPRDVQGATSIRSKHDVPQTHPCSTYTPPSNQLGVSNGIKSNHEVDGGNSSLEVTSMWTYRDPQGDIQGPFSSAEMLEWFAGGYFQPTLLVRRSTDLDFVELRRLSELEYGGQVPFTMAKHQVTQHRKVTTNEDMFTQPLPQTAGNVKNSADKFFEEHIASIPTMEGLGPTVNRIGHLEDSGRSLTADSTVSASGLELADKECCGISQTQPTTTFRDSNQYQVVIGESQDSRHSPNIAATDKHHPDIVQSQFQTHLVASHADDSVSYTVSATHGFDANQAAPAEEPVDANVITDPIRSLLRRIQEQTAELQINSDSAVSCSDVPVGKLETAESSVQLSHIESNLHAESAQMTEASAVQPQPTISDVPSNMRGVGNKNEAVDVAPVVVDEAEAMQFVAPKSSERRDRKSRRNQDRRKQREEAKQAAEAAKKPLIPGLPSHQPDVDQRPPQDVTSVESQSMASKPLTTHVESASNHHAPVKKHAPAWSSPPHFTSGDVKQGSNVQLARGAMAAPTVPPAVPEIDTPSLIEIQAEEERLEQQRLEAVRKAQAEEVAKSVAHEQQKSTWASRMNCGNPTPVMSTEVATNGHHRGQQSCHPQHLVSEKQNLVNAKPFASVTTTQHKTGKPTNVTTPVSVQTGPATGAYQPTVPAKKNPPTAIIDSIREQFESWAASALAEFQTSQLDIPTFISFLNDIDSPDEVNVYVKSYIGESRAAKNFGKEYLQRRSKCRNAIKHANVTGMNDASLCRPATVITSTSVASTDSDSNRFIRVGSNRAAQQAQAKTNSRSKPPPANHSSKRQSKAQRRTNGSTNAQPRRS